MRAYQKRCFSGDVILNRKGPKSPVYNVSSSGLDEAARNCHPTDHFAACTAVDKLYRYAFKVQRIDVCLPTPFVILCLAAWRVDIH